MAVVLALLTTAWPVEALPEITIEHPAGTPMDSSGSVVAWGSNSIGQTNVPVAAQSGVMAVAAGAFYTAALKTDGSVLVWGGTNNGVQTVPAGPLEGVVAIASGQEHILALRIDGTIVAWGRNGDGETTVPPAAQSGVRAVAAGTYHTVALKSDGSVIAWGANTYGQHPDRMDATLTVQAADTPAGPWTDLARSMNGSAFTILAAGATSSESGAINPAVTVADLYPGTDPAHPRRFMRLRVTGP